MAADKIFNGCELSALSWLFLANLGQIELSGIIIPFHGTFGGGECWRGGTTTIEPTL